MRQFRSKAFRVIRDLSVLGVLCGCFYLLTLAFSEADADDDATSVSSIAKIRKVVNQDIGRRDWESAFNRYDELIELDPYFGLAYKSRADCMNQLRLQCLNQVDRIRQSGIPDPERKQELTAQEQELADQAIVAYEATLDFARYRGESLEWLARLYSMKSRFEGPDQKEYRRKSIEYLKSMVDQAFCTRRGIAVISDFEYIKDEPEFENLCKLEDEVVARDPYYRTVRASLTSGLRATGF
jgi:tetratricopeptide (TPR) repeat protein